MRRRTTGESTLPGAGRDLGGSGRLRCGRRSWWRWSEEGWGAGAAAGWGGGAGPGVGSCGAGGGLAAGGGGAAAGSARCCCWWGGSGRCAITDDRQDGADLDRLALGDPNLGDRSTEGSGDLGVDLVGRHLEQHLVLGDGVTDLLEPSGDGPFGDGLAQLGHLYVGHVDRLLGCSGRLAGGLAEDKLVGFWRSDLSRGATGRSWPGRSRRTIRSSSGGAG